MRQHMRYLRWLSVALALFIAPRMAGAQQPVPAKASTTAPGTPGYAGSAACLDCHKESVHQFEATVMGKLIKENGGVKNGEHGCESCHGPSKAHVESGGDVLPPISYSSKARTTVVDRNATCLNCHEKTSRTMWAGSTHESRNVSCTDCHVVMHDNTERSNLKKASVLATCGSCHREKAAAMSKFSHMPLGEGKLECISSNCHDPHGSNKIRMLKYVPPRLCQQCHLTPHGAPSGRPEDQASVRFNYNKGCVNCHSQIHGSNHPAGVFFTR